MKPSLLFNILAIGWITGFAQEPETDKTWKIDSIQIKKNWRTRDKIVLRELQLKQGDEVDMHCFETSINQIWRLAISLLSHICWIQFLPIVT
jgi:hypothetical protein